MITGINHIGICVKCIDNVLDVWKKSMNPIEIGRASYPKMGQTSAMIKIGSSFFELMEPIGEEGVIAEFLKKYGEGIHHISIHSTNIRADKAAFEAVGIRVLGKAGDPMLFTHPKSNFGIVFEITENENEKIEI